MKWFEKIKRFYEKGLWNDRMVKDAVKKGKITEKEYKEITGNDYVADNL